MEPFRKEFGGSIVCETLGSIGLCDSQSGSATVASQIAFHKISKKMSGSILSG
jgi:hypothetical protein